MKGLNAAKAAIGEFQFSQFQRIWEIRLTVYARKNERTVVNLYMVLEAENRKPAARLQLLFKDVHSLHIDEIDRDGHIRGLEIEDISGDQLENVSWRVRDYEEGSIAFYSSEAEVVGAEAV